MFSKALPPHRSDRTHGLTAAAGFVVALSLGAMGFGTVLAQTEPQFQAPQILTNREASLVIKSQTGQLFRLEASFDLRDWIGLSTAPGAASVAYLDSAAPFASSRFYRTRDPLATNALTGDHLQTADGEITFHPVEHASFVISWKGKTIYCDPVGGAAKFQGLPRADLILVTHAHSDHFEVATINAVRKTNAVVVVPPVVFQGLSASLKATAVTLTNAAKTNLLEVEIEAVPAYNLTSSFHPRGTGNGYVLTIGGKRLYASGDTEDIPELRELPDIDVAFVCMNLPYTMSVEKAADAVRDFKPKVVYLYHFRGFSTTDVNRFKALVGTDQGTEVRLRKWY